MPGHFSYHNPAKLSFGKDALDGLREETRKYGKAARRICGGCKVLTRDEVVRISRESL